MSRARGKNPAPFANRPWSPQTGRDLDEALQGIEGGLVPLTEAPDPPSTVQAGVDAEASPIDSSVPALEDHVHDVDTAAPSNPTGPSASEGTGTALMRADATIQQGIVTTKGDILTHSGTPDRLPVGADGQVLVADAAEPTGLKWENGGAAVLETIPESEREVADYALYHATTSRYALTVFIWQNFNR